jgi:hypothetical protein
VLERSYPGHGPNCCTGSQLHVCCRL